MFFNQVDNEVTLLHNFRDGNEDAFNEIYSLYSQHLYLFANRYVQDAAEAEDITAEIFIKLWDRRKQFDSLHYISTFLHKAIKNRCLDYLRHQQVKSKNQQGLMQLLEQVNDNDFSAEIIRLELIKLIYAEAEKLPPKMKEIFLLSYKEGLKPADIAERLSINVQTVKNQRVTAVNLLKVALQYKPQLAILLSALTIEGKTLI